MGLVLPASVPAPLDLPYGLEPGRCEAYAVPGNPGHGLLPAGQLRRLGRAQRLALLAAHGALAGRDLQAVPPLRRAICLGTGLGEAGETTAFLEHLLVAEVREARPARFVNSVHNSLAAHIAMHFDFQGENHTVAHNAISFEMALWQALVLLRRQRADVALACGVDALNPFVVLAGCRFRWWGRREGRLAPLGGGPPQPGTMPGRGTSPGTTPGEGAAGLLLARPGALPGTERLARLAAVRARARPAGEAFDAAREAAFIEEVLAGAGASLREVDLVILGANGDAELDRRYESVLATLRARAGRALPAGVYKQRCGEFCTAPALSAGLAAISVSRGAAADEVDLVGGGRPPAGVGTVLVVHLSAAGHHSALVVGA